MPLPPTHARGRLGGEEVRVGVHVADPRRLAGVVLALLLVLALAVFLAELTSPSPVPIGRS
jgi:hypothetical protein